MSKENGRSPSYPVVGIDPGRVTAVTKYPLTQSPPRAHVIVNDSLEGALDLVLPCYLFIEQPPPPGDGLDPTADPALMKLSLMVYTLVGRLAPFDRDRQLVPPKRWKKIVLGDGDADKQAAVNYAREHWKGFREAERDHGLRSIDLAESYCLVVYGRLLVTGKLDRAEPLKRPRYDLMSPAVPRGKGSGLKGRPAKAYKLGLTRPDDPRYDNVLGGLRIPWALIERAGGRPFAAAFRVWASGYDFALEHGDPTPVTWHVWADAAAVSPTMLPEHVAALVAAGLVERDPDDPNVFLFRPVPRPTALTELGRLCGKRSETKGRPKPIMILLERWERGELQGAPPLAPTGWRRQTDRERQSGRYVRQPCLRCGYYNIPRNALYQRPDGRLEGEPLCLLCQQDDARAEAVYNRALTIRKAGDVDHNDAMALALAEADGGEGALDRLAEDLGLVVYRERGRVQYEPASYGSRHDD